MSQPNLSQPAANTRRIPIALLFPFMLAAGCQQPQAEAPLPLALPAWHLDTHHFVGSPQSGPYAARPGDVDIKGCARVSVTWTALAEMPADLLSPIQPEIQRIVQLPRSELLQPVAQLSGDARWGRIERPATFIAEALGDRVDRSVSAPPQFAALPVGVTATFGLAPEAASSVEGTRIELQLYHRESDRLQVALAHSVPLAERTDTPNPDPAPTVTELVVLEPIALSGRASFALLLPYTTGPEEIVGLLVLVEADTREGLTIGPELIAECRAHLAEASLPTPAEQTGDIGRMAALQEAVYGLQQPVRWRNSLLLLAGATQASFAEDVALSGSPTLTRELAHRAATAFIAAPAPSPEELGWRLEQLAYGLILEEGEEDALPPALLTWLTLHTGQLGRDPQTLKELVAVSESLQRFEQALLKENLLFLLDMSPAARMRAYEWLRGQGESLDGYHPLAPPADRRLALAKAEDRFK